MRKVSQERYPCHQHDSHLSSQTIITNYNSSCSSFSCPCHSKKKASHVVWESFVHNIQNKSKDIGVHLPSALTTHTKHLPNNLSTTTTTRNRKNNELVSPKKKLESGVHSLVFSDKLAVNFFEQTKNEKNTEDSFPGKCCLSCHAI